jgi:MoxR-like ATPase
VSDYTNRDYTGTGENQYEPLAGAWREPEPYIASSDLTEAVNMAIYLRRPLLLEGDPGVGKTRLAYAIAYELGYPLLPIYIRSTSRAQDLLYTFDAVRRLYDIQERTALQPGRIESKDEETVGASEIEKKNEGSLQKGDKEKEKYVKLGRLGEAIKLSEQNIPSVVLIDEIDKADIDFPNDLLLVLDRLQFDVDEVPGWRFDAFKGQEREERRGFLPLIIITSNREKELPAPFLRRCLFYYINFPNEQELTQIVQSHFQTGLSRLFDEALKKFWELHDQKGFTWRKSPSTSELLDWLAILEKAEKNGSLTAEKLAATTLAELPHLEALVKTQSDLAGLSRLQIEREALQDK